MKKLLLFLVIIVSFSSVQAALIDDLSAYYSFDTNADDDHASYDGTPVNDAAYTSSGKINGGFALDGTGDEITLPNIFTTSSTFSISYWVYMTGSHANMAISTWDGANNRVIFQSDPANNFHRFAIKDGVSQSTANWATTVNTAQWYHIVGTYDGTDTILYVDGTQRATASVASGSIDDLTDWVIGQLAENSANRLEGTIDEVGIWNKELTPTEVTELYNSGDGLAYPFTVASNNPPNVTNFLPYDDDHLNNITIVLVANISDDDNDTLNCDLYIDDVLNSSNNSLTSSTASFTVNNLVGGIYDWYVSCTDGEDVTNSTEFTFIIDQTNPLFYENTLSPLNTTRYNTLLLNNVLNFSSYWYDNYMFAYNITINYPNGSIAFTNNDTGLTSTKQWVNNSINITGWPEGDYLKTDCGSDDHTANIWDPDLIETSNQDITIWKDENYIKIENTQGNLKSIDYDCTPQDRCGFSFEPNNNRRRWYFQISSNQPLNYRGELYPFPTFVASPMWADFVTQSERVEYLEVTDIQEYSAIIHIEMDRDNNERIIFDSIGGLNVVCEKQIFNLYTPVIFSINNGFLSINKI